MENTLVTKLEAANHKTLALQEVLFELQQKSSVELNDLRIALQEVRSIAEVAVGKAKKGEENARDSKERAKRLKHKIEKFSSHK
jgi:hypothetical protein